MSLLLTVDPATTTMLTSRLTQRHQTTSPLSPAARSSLCSHEVSDRWVPSLPPPPSLLPSFGVVCFWLVMAFPEDFTQEFVPRSPVSPFDLEHENILEDHGVSWQIGEMLALEVETHRRCFPVQPALPASQRYNRRKRAFLLGILPLQLTCRLTVRSTPSNFWI